MEIANTITERVPLPVSAVSAVTRGKRAKWWRRRGSKQRGFYYEDCTGKRITNEVHLERIRSLVIPPAWREVRISPSARTPLQAIGLDASGRVQRLYHSAFAARMQQRKYEKLESFGRGLGTLRRTTNEHIKLEDLSRHCVLAVVVRLINDLYFRVGSEESVKRYRTFGITTLRNRHLEIKRGGQLVFSFVGKHHIPHRRIIVDADLASLMRSIKQLRGSRLFNYYDEEKHVRPVTPRDVNDYIKSAAGPQFSAKDFRTWGGTLLAAIFLAELGPVEGERAAKRNIVKAVKRVAERLGNTPSVCRDRYIHPVVLEKYMKGITLDQFRPRKERYIRQQQPEYDVEELALIRLLSASNGKDHSVPASGDSRDCDPVGIA